MSAINFSGQRTAETPRFSGLNTDVSRRENFYSGGLRKIHTKPPKLNVLPTPMSMIDRYTRGTANKFWEACPEMDARLVKVNGSINGTNIIGRSTSVISKSLFDPRFAVDYQQNVIPNLGISNTRKIKVSNF